MHQGGLQFDVIPCCSDRILPPLIAMQHMCYKISQQTKAGNSRDQIICLQQVLIIVFLPSIFWAGQYFSVVTIKKIDCVIVKLITPQHLNTSLGIFEPINI